MRQAAARVSEELAVSDMSEVAIYKSKTTK